MTRPEILPETRPDHHRLGAIATMAALTVTAGGLFGAGFGATAYVAHHKLSAHHATKQSAPNRRYSETKAASTSPDQACPTPSPTDLHTVTSELSSPAPATKSSRGEVARQLGLTLSYKPEVYKQLDSDYNSVHPRPFRDYLRVTRNYLATRYGVSLTVDPPEADPKTNPNNLSITDMNLQTAKYDLLQIIYGLKDVPVQYLQAAGFSQLHLTYAPYAKYGAQALIGTPEIDFNVAFYTTPAVIGHETYHLIDGAECGVSGMSNDPSFTSLNQGDIYKPNQRGSHITYNSLQTKQTFFYQDELRQAVQQHKYQVACGAQRSLDAAAQQVQAYSKYGLTNDVEDKAEIGAQIPFPDSYAEMLTTASPVLRAKFLLEMTRLYELVPNVASYFIDTSSHPRPTLSPALCTR